MSERENANDSDVVSFAFNRKKIRYAFLADAIQDSILDTSVTFFIDMRYVLDITRIEYYKQAVTNEIIPNSNRVLAELLNLIVHYKRYFTEKRGCRTTFVLMFDNGEVDADKAGIIPAYGQAKLEKTVKPKFLGFIANKMQRIAPCIPDIKVVNAGSHELSVIPFVIRDEIKSKYNVFLTDDPLIHQASQIYKNFSVLRSNGEHSKVIGKNEYFQYLFEKNKWTVKSKEESQIDDSYIRLFLNLTGNDDDCAIEGFKNKKAVNLINKLKRDNVRFMDYDSLAGEVNEESIETMKERDPCFNNLSHATLIEDAAKVAMVNQLLDSNRPSRNEFATYNREYFNNIVDDTVLFMTN